MSIRVYLPSRFYYLWKDKDVIELTGKKTVAECLDELVRIFPLMKNALSYESGSIDPQVKVLVNQERVGKQGLAAKVNDGDEVCFELSAQ